MIYSSTQTLPRVSEIRSYVSLSLSLSSSLALSSAVQFEIRFRQGTG
jgi:hypothetical protein